ncbi:hypothetical protein HDU86_005643 [Geranomyces michiganensis]|nr:hypothetical protein HDU86_005643 [Geranomyces michiganensis]
MSASIAQAQPQAAASHQPPRDALQHNPTTFGIDTLFEPTTTFIRRATDAYAPSTQTGPSSSSVVPRMDPTADGADRGAEGHEATAIKIHAEMGIIMQRLQQDAWMYTKPRHKKQTPNRRGCAIISEVGVNIGDDLAAWLANNQDLKDHLSTGQDDTDMSTLSDGDLLD